MRTPPAAVALVVALGVLFGSGAASAQGTAPLASDGVAPDDVAWETRTEPYFGGPVRPGAGLDAYPNGATWPGGLGLLLGYALSFAAIEDRAVAVTPIVGPWLALANVTDERLAISDGITAAMVVSGVVQPVGLALLIVGLAVPDVYLVFDAPVAVLPRVGSDDVGLQLSGRF